MNVKSDISLNIGYIGSLKFGCYYLPFVPKSKPFDHALFEDIKAITLYCTLLYCTVLYCTVLYCTVLYCT